MRRGGGASLIDSTGGPDVIPKSLHTITALVHVARQCRQLAAIDGKATPPGDAYAYYVEIAATILGYPPSVADPHRLRERAAVAFRREDGLN